MQKRQNSKNGLIELIRFICSLWVAYYHGFLPISYDYYNGAAVPVDIFFIITGYFFLKSIGKYKDIPFLKGARLIVWSKVKSFIVPLTIAFISVTLCNVLFELDFGGFNWPLSFLWFFAAQFSLLLIFYLVYKKSKRLASFNIFCALNVLVSMSLFRLNVVSLNVVFRCPAMLALGILLSQVSKINIKLSDSAKAKILNVTINSVGFAVSLAALLYFAYLPEAVVWRLHLLCCIICPLLVYFATSLPVRSKVLNLLGEFSIFIYLAQCPILFHHYIVSRNPSDQFPLLCASAVTLFVLNRIINQSRIMLARKRA